MGGDKNRRAVAKSNGGGLSGYPSVRFVVGMLIVALGAWFLVPSIQQRRDMEHGVRTIGTLQQEPGDCVDGCQVRFDVAGTPVVADLPAYELIKRFHKGSSLEIRYHPDHPERIALEDDLDPSWIIVDLLIPLMGLILIISALAAWARPRRRRPRTL
jgi:hypothetical protein